MNNRRTGKLRILLAMGAFKDVYTPIEACQMLERAFRAAIGHRIAHIQSVPMADGGEYSCSVLSGAVDSRQIRVSGVIDPKEQKTTCSYLALSTRTAFIGSSEVLRLEPQDDRYKNPLRLTSFGLGQLIHDAVGKGFQELIIGLGGTSTVDGGVGMAQALGMRFRCRNGSPVRPKFGRYFTGSDLLDIARIDSSSLDPRYKQIKVTLLCDTTIGITGMKVPTDLKIGRHFDRERREITIALERGLRHYATLTGRHLGTTGLARKPFLGVAGGVCLSLACVFEPTMQLGVDFFLSASTIEKAVRESDLVVTGEGRFDISLKGKVPAGVAGIALKHGKPVLLACGDVEPGLRKHFSKNVAHELPRAIASRGITGMASCHEFYEGRASPESYTDRVEMYRRDTPGILTEALKVYFAE